MDPKKKPIAYVTHPVTRSLKAYILGRGYRIIDAKFAPDGSDIIDGQAEAPDAEPVDLNIETTNNEGAGSEPAHVEAKVEAPQEPVKEGEAIEIPADWENSLDWPSMKKLAAAIAPDQISAQSNKEQVTQVIAAKVAELKSA